jgi:pimeloyl-ACP methyl ester carboxylesterase
MVAQVLEDTASRISKEGMDIAIQTSRSYNSIQDKFEDIQEKVRNVLLTNNPISYANGSKAVAKNFRGGYREDILNQISISTLIILGDHDSAPLEGAVKMYKGIKDSRLAVIPGSGHYTILEKPKLTSIIIKDFLKDLN